MKITFLGAVEEVTGSKYLIVDHATKILVDCGLFQGDQKIMQRNWEPLPIVAAQIDAIVLTHAHIDHTGYIPLLVKQGFKGKIYCSQATYELCAILLVDSGSLQEEEAKKHLHHRKKNSHSSILPLYTRMDAETALNFFQVVNYDTIFYINSLQVTLIRSGHILGSAFVIVSDGKQKLTFSGDLGRPQQMIQKSPPHLKKTDFLVLESTYGGALHATGDSLQALCDVINDTVKKAGILIIPCFAVERTQVILYCLYKLKEKKAIADLPIFLDSPMAIDVTNLFCKFPDEHNLSLDLCQKVFGIATYTRTVEESKALDQIKQSAIIIAGSGMADGGRVLYHLERFISDAKNTVVFVGFQAQETDGRRLVDGAKEIYLDGKSYPVRADIKTIQIFSAHADCDEILEWLSHFENPPKKIFLTHGEIESAQALKQKIEQRFGWSQVIIPKYLDSFDLD